MLEFTPEQQDAVSRITLGISLLIMGPGGVGKSLIAKQGLPAGTVKVAPTGCAAVLAGGKTIHSYFSFKHTAVDDGAARVVETLRPAVTKKLKQLKVLCIDEFSMVSAPLFDLIDAVLRLVRKNDMKMGGVQLILMGDPFQLKPINGSWIFTSPIFKEMFPPENIVSLTKVMRQSDETFVNMLCDVRLGNITESVRSVLESRVQPPPDSDQITFIMPRKDMVEEKNKERLKSLPGEEIVITTRHRDTNPRYPVYESVASKAIRESPFEEKLVLKKGAFVMFTRNSSELKVQNGTMGVVTFCTSTMICVDVKGREVRVEPETLDMNPEISIKIMGFPLTLAWAVTGHKVQGATLESAAIYLGPQVFAPGWAYVALSRVKNLDKLYISELDPSKIWADQACLEYFSGSNKRRRLNPS
jgi:hypothetical protein